MVAVFLFDVLGDGTAQPLQSLGQTRAARHQQGHRVLDVVIGLGEEALVLGQGHMTGQRVADDRKRLQTGALGSGFMDQFSEEGHGYLVS